MGGVFGLAVALIAETVPSGARAQSLGLLQVLSTVGNVTAGFALKGIATLEKAGTIQSGSGWRWMFLIGAVPAVMVIFTGKYLREPETWLRLKESGRLAEGGLFGPYGLYQVRLCERTVRPVRSDCLESPLHSLGRYRGAGPGGQEP